MDPIRILPGMLRRGVLVLLAAAIATALPSARSAAEEARAADAMAMAADAMAADALAGDALASERRLSEEGWTVDSLRVAGIDEPGVRRVQAYGRVRLPAGEIWSILASQDEEDNWPGIKESILESSAGDTMFRRYSLSIPVYKDRRYRLRVVADDAARAVRFAMVPGYGNVRAIRGSWSVEAECDTVSFVHYVLETDPGVKLVPGFIVNWATKKAIPRLYRHIWRLGSSDPDVASSGVRPRTGR